MKAMWMCSSPVSRADEVSSIEQLQMGDLAFTAKFQPLNTIYYQVSGPQTTGTKKQRQHWKNESSWLLQALDSSNILVRKNLGTRIPVSLSR